MSPAWSSCSTRTCSTGSTAGPTRSPSRYGLDRAGFDAGNRKQAHVPVGAAVLGMAGTAPGVILPVDGSVVVVLPGLAVGAAPPVGRRARARRAGRRLRGAPGRGPAGSCACTASASRTSPTSTASAGGDPAGVETSICARSFEIEIDIRADPGHEAGRSGARRGRCGPSSETRVFATDERPLAEIVLDLLAAAGLHAGDRRVVHRRAGRRRARRHRRAAPTAARRRRRLRERGQARPAGVSRRRCSRSTARSRRGGRGDGERGARRGSGPTRRSPSRASPGRAAARRRSRSGWSTCTSRRPRARTRAAWNPRDARGGARDGSADGRAASRARDLVTHP